MPTLNLKYGAAALALLPLAACGGGDPEQNAANAIDRVAADLEKARASYDPSDRLDAYEDILSEIETISERYGDTSLGARLAEGRNTGGISPSGVKQARDRLAPRAACYEAPSVDCLSLFTSETYDRGRSENNDPALQARSAICSPGGIDAARTALEPLKINAGRYRDEWVQVAFAAHACDKDEVVSPAIQEATAAETAGISERARFQFSILNTPDLSAAWPTIANSLDASLDELPDAQSKANAALQLAKYYAATGQTSKAIDHATFVTEDLGFDISVSDRIDILTNLMVFGALDDALPLAGNANNAIIAKHRALTLAAEKLAGFNEAGEIDPSVDTADYTKLFMGHEGDADLLTTLPPDAEKATLLARTETMEAALDAMLSVNGWQRYIGSTAHAPYSALAFAYERLGETERADAALAKARSANMADPRMEYLIALRRADYDRAFSLLTDANGRHRFGPAIIARVAAAGDATQALGYANRIGGALGPNLQIIVRSLLANGYRERAIQVLASVPASDPYAQGLAWELAEAEADAGEIERFRQLVDQYQLEQGPRRNPLRVKLGEVRAFAAAGKDSDARSALREAFEIGQALDGVERHDDWGNRMIDYAAEEAPQTAFELGYSELGFELFEQASWVTHDPLVKALDHAERPKDLTRILMAGHDRLDGEHESYLVNFTVTHLKARGEG